LAVGGVGLWLSGLGGADQAAALAQPAPREPEQPKTDGTGVEQLAQPTKDSTEGQTDASADGKTDGKGSVVNPVLPKLLGPGDAAPSIAELQHVSGEKLERFEAGTIYVLDFWATWCGPCIRAMPHMSELAKKYKDRGVNVHGISIWENELRGGQTLLERVREFVRGNESIAYSMSYGGDDGELARRWMNGAGRSTIPTVFVIGKDGKIAWIGHPMIGLDDALAKIVAGTFDPAKEREAAQQRENNRQIGMRMATRLQQRVQAKDWEAALEIADNIIELDAAMFAPTSVAKMRILAKELRDAQRAKEWGTVSLEKFKNSPLALREQARLLLEGEGDVRDLGLAKRLAERGVAVASADDTETFLVLADVQAALGDSGGARATLELARQGASEPNQEVIRARLEKLP
jgi:thiol-disulfide isomerase/thioredoxin